jgi:hypothetical protein
MNELTLLRIPYPLKLCLFEDHAEKYIWKYAKCQNASKDQIIKPSFRINNNKPKQIIWFQSKLFLINHDAINLHSQEQFRLNVMLFLSYNSRFICLFSWHWRPPWARLYRLFIRNRNVLKVSSQNFRFIIPSWRFLK